jgi:hypothetical protein
MIIFYHFDPNYNPTKDIEFTAIILTKIIEYVL